MTGRDLIMYILANGLEDEPVFKDGKLIGFMTLEEAAAKHNVGAATMRTWAGLGIIDCVRIGDVIYIHDSNPRGNPITELALRKL